ncbi:21366_t:CDS:2 [Gigaspora margarita]|uniref:21366_t:CDS:1 n=1 Tax=Gigaspora margarita TaxID=4874 RepID=A0ABN7UZ12_GIGMA|nr:21366_t:CDS:2 [Gigaspora margarita]
MTAATSVSVSDIAKPSMGAMKRRSILIPQSSNHRDKLKDAIKKKAIDEIVELFIEAQQIGKTDTGIITMILDHMKKRNTNAGEGTGTTKNIDMAIHYYSKAAKLGHEGSQFVLNKLLKATNSPPLQI